MTGAENNNSSTPKKEKACTQAYSSASVKDDFGYLLRCARRIALRRRFSASLCFRRRFSPGFR